MWWIDPLSHVMNRLDDTESENTRLKVSISDAKTLVSSWIGGGDSEGDESEPDFGTISAWSGQGLGALPPKKKDPPSKILKKLKPRNSGQRPNPVGPKESSESEEEESRTTMGRKRKKHEASQIAKKKGRK